MNAKFTDIVSVIRKRYGHEGPIPLHAPFFGGNEKKYLEQCIDTTYVSSVGPFVNRFESMMADLTGSNFAVATVNGTSALHTALLIAGVNSNDEVISQALTFVATANAISYIGASPIFIDVDKFTLGMCPRALENYLRNETFMNSSEECINKITGKRIRACVPMHTFGLVSDVESILEICNRYNIILVEDAAESIGSYLGSRHTGTFGHISAFSFNGNKTITSGGGGAIITNNEEWAKRAKHITTTAKAPHAWHFFHDEIGYNYRMPNINAAIAVAQLEQLSVIIENKRQTADFYKSEFAKNGIHFVEERLGTSSNYWLNTLLMNDKDERDAFLAFSNNEQVMTRPAWVLMNRLPAFQECQHDGLKTSLWLEERIINIPSSYIP